MKKTGFALVLAAMLVVPSAAMAAPTKADTKAASAYCHTLKEKAGSKANFQSMGFKNMGACVSKMAKDEAAERRTARRQASKECKDAGHKGRAYGQCVKETRKEIKAELDAEDKETVNAARACRAEKQEKGADAFNEEYGKNENDRNAFGKCVSAKAQAQNDEEEETPES